MPAVMTLYYAETVNPRKVCAVARHLGSPVEYRRVDLARGEHLQPAYLAVNPNGKVPALTEGSWCLWEANAIMCHLALRAGSDLWPQDERQIEILRWFGWETDHFSRAGGTLYFERLIKPQFGMGDPDPAAIEQATGEFRRFAAVLENHLEGREWLVGDRLTVADFAVASTLPYADEVGIPLREFPRIARWNHRLNGLEAWRAPFPAATPTAA